MQGGAVVGQQCLVRADHALALLERAEQQGAGRLDAADEFDDDVDVVAFDKCVSIGGEQVCRHAGVPGRPAHRDADEFERRADARGKIGCLLVEQTHHL